MRAKAKKRKTVPIVVTFDIPVTFNSRDESLECGKKCRTYLEQELGRKVFEFANVIVDWPARKATAKIRVIDRKKRVM